METNNKKEKDPGYYVNFKGATVTKTEANRIGVGIVFGIIGIIVVLLLPLRDEKILSYSLITMFIFIGYFIVSPLIFKKSKSERPTMKM